MDHCTMGDDRSERQKNTSKPPRIKSSQNKNINPTKGLLFPNNFKGAANLAAPLPYLCSPIIAVYCMVP